MKKTIIITGASSGIGKATAKIFHQKGWNVVATMRNISSNQDLVEDDTLKLVSLDVQDKATIKDAIDKSIKLFGKVDVLFNNAGYGAYGPLEAGSDEEIRRQYNVNFFGVVDCIKAILPHFKSNKDGLIISTTSIGGLMTVPLYSVYNSSKFALEGLSEALWYELKPFGIDVKIIEPGSIKTDFSGRSLGQFDISNFPEYKQYNQKIQSKFGDPKRDKTKGSPEMVAEIVFTAATDGKDTLRYLAGKDAKQLWFIRRWFGYKFQMKQVRKYFGI